MVPKGYCTLIEALAWIGDYRPDWDARDALNWAVDEGPLGLFVERNGEALRLPTDDIGNLLFSDVWPQTWLQDGRMPSAPIKPELEEWVREYHPELVRLRGQRLLFSEEVLRSLYSTEPGPVPLERAGAPGRPSSMHLILNEFERRRAAGSCENSRSAEAERLAAWLKETHPDNPRATAKTIRNALPADFQPARN